MGKKYVVSTGSMNYVYIWEKVTDENASAMDVEILQVNKNPGIPPPSIPGAHQPNYSHAPMFGWNTQVMGHEDFAHLSASTQVVFVSDDEEDNMECEDDIIVYNNPSVPTQGSRFAPTASGTGSDDDDDEIQVHFAS